MKLRITTLLLGAAFASSAPASNINYLKDSPVARFDQRDQALLLGTLKHALDKGVDGKPVTWRNDATGSAGEITPLKTLGAGDGRCRETRIVNVHKSLRSEAVHTLCRQPDGEWKVK